MDSKLPLTPIINKIKRDIIITTFNGLEICTGEISLSVPDTKFIDDNGKSRIVERLKKQLNL